MIIISKKNNPHDDQPTSMDEANLTPWQKENLRYMKNKGTDPSWSPTIIDGMTEDPEKNAEENPEDEIESESIPAELEAAPEHRSFSDRLPNLKKYRNSVLMRRLLVIISILMIPLLLVIYYVSPLSKLANVTVSGNQTVDATGVIEASGLKLSGEIWPQFIERNEAQEAIKTAYPRVKTATITFVPLNKFTIQIQEFATVALLGVDNSYSPILENGVVLEEKTDQAETGLPILENFTDKEKIKETLLAYQKLSAEIKAGISQIKYAPRNTNDELLNIYMDDGNQVIVNISNMVSQMQFYPQIVKDLSEKSVIDMEVGIFTYPIDQTETTETTESTEE